MNIDKYIENTKRKTKKAKLPALSTLSPVLPDAAAGISTFNASFGEELSNSEIYELKDELETECIEFMIEKGFDESEIKDSLHIDITQYQQIVSIVIKANLTISSLRELADTLYPITSQYDDESYFDISANNTISIDLDISENYEEGFKQVNITEKLHELDRRGFEIYDENYDFEALYESTKSKLDSNDRAKLQKFLQTTDDPEAVNTYMKGLLMEETIADDVEEVNYDVSFEEIEEAFDVLQTAISHLVNEANAAGNDSLRMSADSALSKLDDFNDYLSEIKDEIGDVYTARKASKLPDAQVYVDRFIEMYPTKEEFEDATGDDLVDYEVQDIITDWVIEDNDLEYEDEVLADDIAFKATKEIMKELQ